MIAEIMLGLVSIALIVGFILYVKESNKEKAKLINALIAKNPEQLRDLDLADKVVLPKPSVNPTPELIPEDQLSEEDFDQVIKQQLENG